MVFKCVQLKCKKNILTLTKYIITSLDFSTCLYIITNSVQFLKTEHYVYNNIKTYIFGLSLIYFQLLHKFSMTLKLTIPNIASYFLILYNILLYYYTNLTTLFKKFRILNFWLLINKIDLF